MKQVIFNVGGALSMYIEYPGKKLLVDIGKSKDFNPILDFLVPLYDRMGGVKNCKDGKYCIDQLVISHPHRDHISGIVDFWSHFHPILLTCPNDNSGMEEDHKINWELFDSNQDIDTLREMLEERKPPLDGTEAPDDYIYYLPPKLVEKDKLLNSESYCNNISLAIFLEINGHRIFMPGDLQKCGLERLITQNQLLKNKLLDGVDFLIAPHHGLKSSFSVELFNSMKNRKTNRLNIISEKILSKEEVREIDTRYSNSEFCSGNNNLTTSQSPCNQLKTSRGHILIDYSLINAPKIELILDKDELLTKFMSI